MLVEAQAAVVFQQRHTLSEHTLSAPFRQLVFSCVYRKAPEGTYAFQALGQGAGYGDNQLAVHKKTGEHCVCKSTDKGFRSRGYRTAREEELQLTQLLPRLASIQHPHLVHADLPALRVLNCLRVHSFECAKCISTLQTLLLPARCIFCCRWCRH